MIKIKYTFDQIVEFVKPNKIQGTTKESYIRGIATLSKAQAGDISFLGNLKYKAEVFSCDATIILVGVNYVGSPKENQVLMYVENPSKALDVICRDIEKKLYKRKEPGVHPSAVVDPTAKISSSAHVGPLCIIEKDAVIEDEVVLEAKAYIGQNCIIRSGSTLMPNVTVQKFSDIGERVFLDSGVVIGSEGYGYETDNGVHKKSPQIGRVVIENDVDVGANTTIDRARFHETRIGAGTKIDNLVQIGHNVQVGKNCFIVAFAGIAGSTVIEDSVVIGGQAGIAGHLRVGKGSMLGAQTGLANDLKPNSFVRGTPALPFMLAQRIQVLKKRMPELFSRVAELEKLCSYLNDEKVKAFLDAEAYN